MIQAIFFNYYTPRPVTEGPLCERCSKEIWMKIIWRYFFWVVMMNTELFIFSSRRDLGDDFLWSKIWLDIFLWKSFIKGMIFLWLMFSSLAYLMVKILWIIFRTKHVHSYDVPMAPPAVIARVWIDIFGQFRATYLYNTYHCKNSFHQNTIVTTFIVADVQMSVH